MGSGTTTFGVDVGSRGKGAWLTGASTVLRCVFSESVSIFNENIIVPRPMNINEMVN